MTLSNTLEALRVACAQASSQPAYLDAPALLESGALKPSPPAYVDVQLLDELGARDVDGEAYGSLRCTITAWTRTYGDAEVTIDALRAALETAGWARVQTRNRGVDSGYWGISLDVERLT